VYFMKSTIKSKHAFTLVELLVVIAILAILGTVSIIGYTSFTKKAIESNFKTEFYQFQRYFMAELNANPKVEYTYSLTFGTDDKEEDQVGYLEYSTTGLYLNYFNAEDLEEGEEINLNLEDLGEDIYDLSEFEGTVSFWLSKSSESFVIHNVEFNADSEVCQYKVDSVQYTSVNNDYFSVFEIDTQDIIVLCGDVQ